MDGISIQYLKFAYVCISYLKITIIFKNSIFDRTEKIDLSKAATLQKLNVRFSDRLSSKSGEYFTVVALSYLLHTYNIRGKALIRYDQRASYLRTLLRGRKMRRNAHFPAGTFATIKGKSCVLEFKRIRKSEPVPFACTRAKTWGAVPELCGLNEISSIHQSHV